MIGLLCLNKEMANGEQIVSSKWIEKTSTTESLAGKAFGNMEYGYLWWIIDKEKNTYAAIGNSGNVIYIDSENELVISIASSFKPRVFDRIDFFEEVVKPYILKQDI